MIIFSMYSLISLLMITTKIACLRSIYLQKLFKSFYDYLFIFSLTYKKTEAQKAWTFCPTHRAQSMGEPGLNG